MRSIWKGSVAFGLVNIPVKVYSATEDHDIALHQVHDQDGGRIKYQRRCEICGRVVDYEHIDKAYDDGDRTVILTAEDLSALPAERSHEIEVVEFVASDQLDPIMFDRSYFLEPDSKSPKAYALLRRTLEETDRTAIVHFALRQKTRLGALRVRGDVLLLQSLLWDDEVREAKFPSLDEKVRISAAELTMSEQLVDSFAAEFSPEKFSDEYQDELRQLIEAKLKKGDDVSTAETFGETPDGEEAGGGEVLDLMEALKRSVDASRNKKSSAQKTTAQKTGTQKTAAPKAGASKSGTTKPARQPTARRAAAKKQAS
ncbi:MAG: end-binding protein Ku [Actinomycetota bacterium]|jgi:DNA end-binding protein Ku|nr:end-binding protein Ku [Actinomycetota bacterium]